MITHKKKIQTHCFFFCCHEKVYSSLKRLVLEAINTTLYRSIYYCVKWYKTEFFFFLKNEQTKEEKTKKEREREKAQFALKLVFYAFG